MIRCDLALAAFDDPRSTRSLSPPRSTSAAAAPPRVSPAPWAITAIRRVTCSIFSPSRVTPR